MSEKPQENKEAQLKKVSNPRKAIESMSSWINATKMNKYVNDHILKK